MKGMNPNAVRYITFINGHCKQGIFICYGINFLLMDIENKEKLLVMGLTLEWIQMTSEA